MTSAVRSLLLLFGACGALAGPAAGQTQFLPEERYFRTPLADPNATRMSVGLLSTNLLRTQGGERPPFIITDEDDAATDLVAAVGIGAIFPLVKVAEWRDGGAILYADGKVFARFRLEYETRDDMGQDWFIGGGAEGARGRWSGRAALIHRSSHLGDEFVEATGAERIGIGSEQLDVLAAYERPGLPRVYGGGSWIFRSYLDWLPLAEELGIRDRAIVQLGADHEWRPWRDARFGITAGIDLQAAERTDWDVAVAGALGVGVRTRRSLRLVTRIYDGPSTMSQFFLTRERFFTIEVVAEL